MYKQINLMRRQVGTCWEKTHKGVFLRWCIIPRFVFLELERWFHAVEHAIRPTNVNRGHVWAHMWAQVWAHVWTHVWAHVWTHVWAHVWAVWPSHRVRNVVVPRHYSWMWLLLL